jgi:hypothetical protein
LPKSNGQLVFRLLGNGDTEKLPFAMAIVDRLDHWAIDDRLSGAFLRRLDFSSQRGTFHPASRLIG